jgi:hypothetical protein
MYYDNLDPSARYKLRVVYAGDNFQAKVRLVAAGNPTNGQVREIEVHPFQPKPQPVHPVEFEIPAGADPDRGGAGRGCQIAEVWLIKTRDE